MKIAPILALAAVLASRHAIADDGYGHDHDLARQALEEGRILPLQDILERATNAYPGQMIEVELEREDGVMTYEVKVLAADGKVWKLYYDARSGELLKARGRGR